MQITKINIKCFRNIEGVTLLPNKGINVICGENGQGKTNILEAIWLMSGSSSFLNGKEKEMIPFGGTCCEVDIEYDKAGQDCTVAYRLGEKKYFTRNGIKEKNLSAFSSHFHAIVFAPDDLSTIKGGPSLRRRSLDVIISQLKPQYSTLLNQYNRLLTQRNSLLKQHRDHKIGLETLEEWDCALAKAGALVTKTRKSYCDRLAPLVCKGYAGISNQRETLTLRYESWAGEEPITTALLLEKLMDRRPVDIRLAQTTVGAHRDELGILMDGRSAREFASQGQQRSIILSFKIAESHFIEEMTGDHPIILLDDVLSELDEHRRAYLLNQCTNNQIFITCCDPQQIEHINSIVKIEKGRVVDVSSSG